MSSLKASSVPGYLWRWWHLGTLPWVAVLLRVVLGGVFVFAGFSKLLLPHAEVVAHVQQYQVLPGWLVSITATFLPCLQACMAAPSPPGPLPRTTRSYFVSFMLRFKTTGGGT